MDLPLTAEQELLRASAAAFAARHGGAARLRGGDCGIRPEVWSEAGTAGYLAMCLPDAGFGLAGLCLVARECGRHLVPEPVCASALAAGLAGPGADDARAGEAVLLPAPTPPGGASATAARGAEGLRVDGAVTGVPGAGEADAYLVPARVAGGGAILAVVPAAEVDAAPALAVDNTVAGELRFRNALARQHVADAARAQAALVDGLCLATAAELLGVMETAREITLEYLKVRRQFGRPIGSFQALQHRAVDDLVAVETARALVFQAARALDDGADGAGPASAALSYAAERALGVCRSAIQMHGAIGFTDEHDIGYCLKRAMTLAARWGGSAVQRRRYMLSSGLRGSEVSAPAER